MFLGSFREAFVKNLRTNYHIFTQISKVHVLMYDNTEFQDLVFSAFFYFLTLYSLVIEHYKLQHFKLRYI